MIYAIYGSVLVIWATTPLAIKIGSTSLTPHSALAIRILLAFLIGSIVATISGRGTLNIRKNWKIYSAAAIGLFPNMLLVYKASESISSGLIAVLFGLAPFVTALLAKPLLGENMISSRQLIALVIAITGLIGIFFEQLSISTESATGILYMLASVGLFSFSNTLVKMLGVKRPVESMELALGAMAFSLPGLLITWFLLGGQTIDTSTSSLGVLSIIYLAVFGSLLGYVAYFYILKNMAFGLVSMIPLITPAIAMMISYFLVNEPLTPASFWGGLLIILALLMYHRLQKSH